ncbi:hypothetical protein [Nocardia sp. NPDC060249]
MPRHGLHPAKGAAGGLWRCETVVVFDAAGRLDAARIPRGDKASS